MIVSIDYTAIFIQFLVAVGFVVFAMVVSHNVGPKRKTNDKLAVFECGIESEGNARMPFSIRYFLTAILFVLFDVEVVFMYPWAVNFKSLGQTGFIEILLFVSTLLLGFVYIRKKGALNWE
ncbi:MAG: NADH-quinone oxidoreductase subunit A [Bacteroidetes bacterium]|nr:NADH-quinone oxidoreductase subunit A [Bacteroidota bacterium]